MPSSSGRIGNGFEPATKTTGTLSRRAARAWRRAVARAGVRPPTGTPETRIPCASFPARPAKTSPTTSAAVTTAHAPTTRRTCLVRVASPVLTRVRDHPSRALKFGPCYSRRSPSPGDFSGVRAQDCLECRARFRRGLGNTLLAGDDRRADHDADEGDDAERSEQAVRHVLVVDEDPRGDRERIRAERRKARSREGAAALERELDQGEGEAVARPHRDDQEQEPAAVPGGLRPHIRGCVHQAGGETEPGAGGEERSDGADREPGRDPRDDEPAADREPGRVLGAVLAAGERGREEDEPDHGDADADPLPPREALAERALREDREQGDPARGDCLHERERGQVHGDDVQAPAGDTDQEGDEPTAVAEEDTERPPGAAHGEPRKARRDRVLGHPRPVECGRGQEREHEPDDEGGVGEKAHGTRLAGWISSLPTNSASSRRRFVRSSTSVYCRSPSRTTSTIGSTSS